MASCASKKILIGGWPVYSHALGLNKKEILEDFAWMPDADKFFYTDMRVALDATPGSREFLLSLKPDESHRGPIADAIQDKVSPLHSGSSSSALVGSYRAALRDWDAWVLATKRNTLMRKYKAEQIDFYSLIVFYNTLKFSVSSDEKYQEALQTLSVTFTDGEKPIPVSWENGDALAIVTTILAEQRAQKAEEDEQWRKRRFQERIQYLEFNFKAPCRWFWSGESHPQYSITPEEMAEMEKRRPGYRAHIDLVCRHLHSFGHRAGWKWDSEMNTRLNASLMEVGIIPRPVDQRAPFLEPTTHSFNTVKI
jgi:hypothetical protein